MSTVTLRPSADAFRKAGWLPASDEVYEKWMNKLTDEMTMSDERNVLRPIKEFKEFIETNPTVYQEFVRMFEGITERPRDYKDLLAMFDVIFRKAPYYGDLGPPVYMIMARIMNTQGGFSAFTKMNLNFHFKKMFENWATLLSSKDSRDVLDDSDSGWFSTKAKSEMMAKYAPGRTFEEVFICDEHAPYHGFTSYDDFFNRRFRSVHIDRPIFGGIDDKRIVGAPCESILYHVQENVQMVDELFIKDEAYSLLHLLNNDPLIEEFDGGRIIQGFLGTTDYHRWHAPVTGTIRKIVDVPGTYFAQAPSTIGDPISESSVPYLHSLRYFANTATRQLMFIDAENTEIGLICFISIGMTEISTCQATVYEGQYVKRGDETGMFHFGGSSFAVVFSKASKAMIDGKFKIPETPIKINGAIAAVSVNQ